ncbi:hypothetical protein ACTQ54_00325 [Fundicoccus sp. Sow4_H7]|uniref:hypothetical protein n=1 Tax=Fundicoccus sp. Sow4_H7 TaxID=3438784 RepID=UPI003F934587
MIERQFSFVWKWGFLVVTVSVLCLIFNLPYLYLFLNMLTSTSMNEVGTLFVTAIILIPFVFSPSLLMILKYVRNDYLNKNNGIKLVFQYYKENYLNAISHGFIFIFIVFIVYAVYWFYSQYFIIPYQILSIVYLIISVLYIFVSLYSIDREEKIIEYWKKTVRIWLNHPILCIYMISFIYFIGYISTLNGALLLFAAPGVIIYIVRYFYFEMMIKTV